MSASPLYTVFCDAPNCGIWWEGGIASTAKAARAQLAGTGWALNIRSDEGRTRLDYCPTHATQAQEQK